LKIYRILPDPCDIYGFKCLEGFVTPQGPSKVRVDGNKCPRGQEPMERGDLWKWSCT